MNPTVLGYYDSPYIVSPPRKRPVHKDNNNNNNSLLPRDERSTTEPDPKRRRMAHSMSQSAIAALHFDKGDSVTLIVGPEREELLVHANYIARNSNFFKTALKKEWREGQTRTITMPTDDYEDMTTYLRFVYGVQLPCESQSTQQSAYRNATAVSAEKPREIQAVYESSAKLYILGCRLMDDEFKKAVLTKLINLHNQRQSYSLAQTKCSILNPGPVTVNIIYSETLEHDPARRLVVDMYMKYPQDLNSEYDPGFLLDLAQGFSRTARRELSPGRIVLSLRRYIE